MAELIETEGIVLSKRRYKERDFLVKLFLNDYGKLMFYVRGSKNPNQNMTHLIQPFTYAHYIVDVRSNGLSFIRDAKGIQPYTQIQQDIFKNAYATYIMGLVDASMEDRQEANGLFRQLYYGLNKIDSGFDPEVIMNIFEVKLLYYFGTMPSFFECQVCGNTKGPFDYSSQYGGVLCKNHFDQDPRRLHLHPRVIYHIQQFIRLNIGKIESITITQEVKDSIQFLMDYLYDELVGVHLKSKQFIKDMKSWGKLLDDS